MKTLPIRLLPGQDLRRALESVVAERGCRAAFVLSGIGSLAPASLRLAGAAELTTITGDAEILTLSGSIAVNASHLHAGVSDGRGTVVGVGTSSTAAPCAPPPKCCWPCCRAGLRASDRSGRPGGGDCRARDRFRHRGVGGDPRRAVVPDRQPQGAVVRARRAAAVRALRAARPRAPPPRQAAGGDMRGRCGRARHLACEGPGEWRRRASVADARPGAGARTETAVRRRVVVAGQRHRRQPRSDDLAAR